MRVIEETKTLGKECYERSHFIELDLSSFKSVDNFIAGLFPQFIEIYNNTHKWKEKKEYNPRK